MLRFICVGVFVNSDFHFYRLLDNITGNQCLESGSCVSNSTSDVYHCDDTYCIPKSLVCNGIPDCHQAQDEAVSECGNIYIYIL